MVFMGQDSVKVFKAGWLVVASILLVGVATGADVTQTPGDVTPAPVDATPTPGDVTPEPNDVTRLQQIRALEQVKEQLVSRLRGAIADGVITLNRSGDPAAAAGLQQIRELQASLAELDPSIALPEDQRPEAAPAGEHDNYVARRRGNQRDGPIIPPLILPNLTTENPEERRAIQKAKYWYDFFNVGESMKQLKLEHLNFIPGKKFDQVPAHEKQKLNKKLISERLKQWIIMKREEREKKRQIRLKYERGREKCPRWGRNGKKTYPCCRKCCKTSYLGCL